MKRRDFLKTVTVGAGAAVVVSKLPKEKVAEAQPTFPAEVPKPEEPDITEFKKYYTYDENDWYRHGVWATTTASAEIDLETMPVEDPVYIYATSTGARPGTYYISPYIECEPVAEGDFVEATPGGKIRPCKDGHGVILGVAEKRTAEDSKAWWVRTQG